MYLRALSRDLFADFDRLQRELQQTFELSPSIRGRGPGFPAVNVGKTATALEVYAFVPGVDPASLEVTVDKGLLTLAGTRTPQAIPDKAAIHIGERFAGKFRRVVTLPDDIDGERIQAVCRDGVLQVTLPRRASDTPRRITVQ